MSRFLRVPERLIELLHDKLDKKQFLILSSILVGLTAGLSAVALKVCVHFLHGWITGYARQGHNIYYAAAPLIGIFLSVLFVRIHLKGKLGRGNANILYSIAKKSSNLPRDQMYSHLVTSALTVGLGGSAGLESPIVTTGSAIGSNFGKTYKVTYKDRTLLLASGAAAGIAAAFNSPVAGVLFALEVLLVDVTISAFIPLMIAAAAGALCSRIILNEKILFVFNLRQPFDYHNVPWYMILGLLCGVGAVMYSRIFPRIEGLFKKKRENPFPNAIIGGLILSVLILFLPSLFGEGYDSIKYLADRRTSLLTADSILGTAIHSPIWILVFITVVMLFKVVATAVTIGSGGNGGNFAPSLFVGGYLGFIFSYGITLTGITTLPVANFTLVAMAGMLTGIFHAPLTGIFLIAEITGGYELMIPLMIVSALSYSLVRYFEPFSMDTKKLAKKGHIFTHDKDRNILSTLKVRKIIETDFQPVQPDMNLGQLVDIVAKSHRNIFPVVTKYGELEGIIMLDSIREIMFQREKYDAVTVRQLMRPPAAIVEPDENMVRVMKKFDETGAWNLPVVENNVYIGFVSKSRIFTNYRSRLITASGD
ncbi:MAG TPA: chloride channel protein [Bacteroidia bacterium]|nr:chloride channel protein [Bacteroidia bacterium]